jgi:hypothetical protein
MPGMMPQEDVIVSIAAHCNMDVQSRLASDTPGTLRIGGNHFDFSDTCSRLRKASYVRIIARAAAGRKQRRRPPDHSCAASSSQNLFGATACLHHGLPRATSFIEAQIGDYLAQRGFLNRELPRPPQLGRQQAVIFAVEIDNANAPS